jgi:glycosyltransferase involved in cell wall biosynthesis
VFQQSNSFFNAGIADDVRVILVADMFANEYVGGAELTTQALIDTCPFKIHTVKSNAVTMDLLKQGVNCYWIFGNFANLDPQLIPSIVANLRYSILEYDYKYCRFRSPEKHEASTKLPCDCHQQMNGKLVSAFFYGATSIFWMSEAQKNRYLDLFPFLTEKSNIVLSSVFDDKTIANIKLLREAKQERKGWVVLGSDSWIKGAIAAKKWCEDNKKDYDVIWNLTYEQTLAKLSCAEGFVYLPEGGDTCPRMVIEAKLLGCKLEINDNVQHKNEEWFATDDIESIEGYLYASKKLFWNAIKHDMEYKPAISGYTTTYNCISQKYPFVESIRSMLQFCDEVCIVDGRSTDGTVAKLVTEFMSDRPEAPVDIERTIADLVNGTPLRYVSPEGKTIVIKVVKRDWDHPRSALFDGMQKAEARKMCTKEFCWQMDSDEVVHENDAQKVIDMCMKFPGSINVIALPVIEYWGGVDKVRVDVNPWKWRLSRNKPHITHGVPKHLRRLDQGELYAAPGTDGCDMIDANTFEPIDFINFYVPNVDNVRKLALLGNEESLKAYSEWYNSVVHALPSVFHYSWYDIERKIKLYKNYWTRHWEVLNGKDYVDTAETNMMFDVPWSEVTDDMIKERAKQLSAIGGWIWHRKWNGSITPWITCNRTQPASMLKKG